MSEERRLSVFSFITLNGFYKGPNEDISWHNFGEEEQKMSDELSNAGNTLLFGRITYEMMAHYWASPEAAKNDPVTTKGMNSSEKIVFSKKLDQVSWQNTKLIKGDLSDEVRKLKARQGPDMTLLGSGQIMTQLSEVGLIDSYSFMVNPLAIGAGTSIFQGISKKLSLKLESSRVMKSGNILLMYSRM